MNYLHLKEIIEYKIDNSNTDKYCVICNANLYYSNNYEKSNAYKQ